LLFFLTLPPPPPSTLFPYTTLFRSDSDSPAIARGFRLQWEPAQSAHVLLYPEGMVKLNGSAGEILRRCDGVATLAEIVSDLEGRSEEHTSELQSRENLVCRLLLEKK